jgi:hypothetical protein
LVRSEGSGNAVITNKSGDFELPLKGTEVPGEEIRLFFDNFAYYAVFSPYDARLVLPRYRDRVIEIHMLPIGSRRWWSDDRIEEAVSRYRSSSALDLKGESGAAETLATALRERARSTGFAEDDVQRRVKDWFEANNAAPDTDKRALAGFANPDYALGFTHYWGRARNGGWVIKRETAKSRLKREFQALPDWCRDNRHEPIAIQHQTLKQKLQGHHGYYGITGNLSSLQEFLEGAKEIWKRWLSRRRRAGELTRPEFLRLGRRYRLPKIRVIHSLPGRAANS